MKGVAGTKGSEDLTYDTIQLYAQTIYEIISPDDEAI